MIEHLGIALFVRIGLSVGLQSRCGDARRTLDNGKQCCQNQQISSSKTVLGWFLVCFHCCNYSKCRDNVDINYHNCLGRCDAAAAVIAAQGVIVGAAISMSGAGAPIGIGYATYNLKKGAFVRGIQKRVQEQLEFLETELQQLRTQMNIKVALITIYFPLLGPLVYSSFDF